MFIGSKKLYFVPDLKADELVVREGHVLAEEFDSSDFTIKVRFLNGDAVQKFAVCDTKEELQAAFDKFQTYRKKYWDCYERIQPIEAELKAVYNQLYSDVMDVEFGTYIAHRHDANAVVAEAEKKDQEAANANGKDIQS